MIEIIKELKELTNGYESDFNGKVISKGVMTNDR